MKKLIIAAIGALLVLSCKQERPVQFEQTGSTFTIRNSNLKLKFQLDSIPGAVTVNGISTVGNIGLGGTAPLGLSGFYLPENRASVEIVDWNSERIILHESYPSWLILDNKVQIDRQLTLYTDSCFLEVYDYYYGEFDKLHIASELPHGHIIDANTISTDYEGMSVSLYMEECSSVKTKGNNVIIDKEITRNEPVHYKVYFDKNAN